MCTNFQQNGQLSVFGPKFAQKCILGSKFQKSKSGSGIRILETLCAPIFRLTENFEILGPNLLKNGFWDRNVKNLSLDSESASLRYYVHQYSDKTDNFEFLDPNLPKNGFWDRNFKNLSLDLESTPPKYHVCQFSVKMDNF